MSRLICKKVLNLFLFSHSTFIYIYIYIYIYFFFFFFFLKRLSKVIISNIQNMFAVFNPDLHAPATKLIRPVFDQAEVRIGLYFDYCQCYLHVFKLTQVLHYIPFLVSRPGPLLNWKVTINFKIRERPKWYKYKCLLHNFEFGHAHHCNKGIRQEWQTVLIQIRWLYEPSHLDLHCLQRYLFWSGRLKGLKLFKIFSRKFVQKKRKVKKKKKKNQQMDSDNWVRKQS